MNLQLLASEETAAAEALVVGHSSQGRALQMRFFGPSAAPLRVFLLCGQHGDERSIQRSLDEFLADVLPYLIQQYPALQVAALSNANPDGYAARTRVNGQGIDLNRDHLLLRAPETKAIHRFVAGWQPHLVVDLHNYPARRSQLLMRKVRLAWDVCLDFPSNPAALFHARHPLAQSLMLQLDQRLSALGFLFGRYSVLRKGGAVRHGTPDLVDARNVLALRYDVPTILLEARNPQRTEIAQERKWLRSGAVHACGEILHWAANNAETLMGFAQEAANLGRVPVRMRRKRAKDGVEIPVIEIDTGRTGTLPFPVYRPVVEGRGHISAPLAYAVPQTERQWIQILCSHGFQFHPAQPGERFVVEEQQLPADPSATSRTAPVRYEKDLAGFLLFPFHQQGGRCLPLLLECYSRFALHRLRDAPCAIAHGGAFLVRRVLERCSPAGCPFPFEVEQ